MHEKRKCECDNESKQGIIAADAALTVILPPTLSQGVVIVLIFVLVHCGFALQIEKYTRMTQTQ